MLTKETTYTKDAANNRMKAERVFEAPLQEVWKAWTQSDVLDEWWAPKPWKANTQSMDFREGGSWLYYMQGPDGSRHYCRVDYKTIVPNQSFSGIDAFCDENGKMNTDLPRTNWKVEFSNVDNATKVNVELTFDSAADMEKLIEMGFKEGFAMAHTNLDGILADKKQE